MQRLAGMGGWGRVSRGRLPPSPPDPFFAFRPEIVDVSAGFSASRLGVRPGAGLSTSQHEFPGPEAGSSVPGARGHAPGQDPALESEIPALGLCGWVSGLGFPLREQLGFPPPTATMNSLSKHAETRSGLDIVVVCSVAICCSNRFLSCDAPGCGDGIRRHQWDAATGRDDDGTKHQCRPTRRNVDGARHQRDATGRDDDGTKHHCRDAGQDVLGTVRKHLRSQEQLGRGPLPHGRQFYRRRGRC